MVPVAVLATPMVDASMSPQPSQLVFLLGILTEMVTRHDGYIAVGVTDRDVRGVAARPILQLPGRTYQNFLPRDTSVHATGTLRLLAAPELSVNLSRVLRSCELLLPGLRAGGRGKGSGERMAASEEL